MGLAASQARLLTITSRKSDCEYQSMALSHQKIALSRDMNIVSAEYQDALNQTKLVYDFYGTGDKSTQLSYDLLMNPSQLNDYMPTPVTDPSGRIVLDPALAAAAEAAGIPQEGLGCTPSSDIRDRFVDGLVDGGFITRGVGNSVKSVQYNPYAGIGTSEMITTTTSTITFKDFMDDYLDDISFPFADLTYKAGGSHLRFVNLMDNKEFLYANDGVNTEGALDYEDTYISIKDLLEGDYGLYGNQCDNDEVDLYGSKTPIVDKVGSCALWDTLFASLSSLIDPNDPYIQSALEYAKQETLAKVVNISTVTTFDLSNAASKETLSSAWYSFNDGNDEDTTREAAKDRLDDGFIGYSYVKNASSHGQYNDAYSINLSNMAKAFYTYFAAYMDGLSTTDYKVTNNVSTSYLVTDLPTDFAFDIVEAVDTTGDSLLIANFYDTLFNQIATKGWITNDKVHDNEYLQTMLTNGTMYLSTLGDDDYYYQSNYATNKYIKEVTDEEGIAVAEAKYLREKDKISAKENILDMKMKNLDTEITALTTEYETVKSVISNNVKNSFSRYKA